jgi:DNA-binding Lrp family transcriptional regulator
MTTTHQKNVEEPSKYIIFESILLDELNHRQAILVGLLNGMAKKHGYAYLKNATICQLLKASESSIKSDLKRLEELKIIRRELIRNDKNEVIQRRIYPMSKNYTEVGVKDNHRVGQDLTIPRGKISPRDSNNNIDINNNIENTFEECWKLYTRRGSKKKSLQKFSSLTSKKVKLIQEHLPKYMKNHIENDKLKYLPYFERYINEEKWEDELPYKTFDQPTINTNYKKATLDD